MTTPEGPEFASPSQHYAPAVETDPEAAGLRRQERMGVALPLAALGIVLMVVGLVLDWVRATRTVVYAGGESGRLGDDSDRAGVFGAVDAVEGVVGSVPRFHESGALAAAAFPWGVVVGTVVAALLVAAAAFGLRRRSATMVARVVAVLAVLGALTVGAAGALDLGWTPDLSGGGSESRSTVPTVPEDQRAPQGEAEPMSVNGEVLPAAGAWIWIGGALLLLVAGALGPRVTYRLPDGGPGAYPPVPGARPAMRSSTQPVAVVVASSGTLLCVAGYGFLPWAPDVVFAEISDAVRELGSPDAVVEAYFGWLGWALLLASVVVAALVALGRGRAVNPRVVRPVLAVVMLLGLVAHGYALVEIGIDEGSLGLLATTAGLAASLLGALLPLRTRVTMLPSAPGPMPGPPGPAGPPPPPPPFRRPPPPPAP